MQERDEARSALETAQSAAPVANGKRAADDEDIAQPAKKVLSTLHIGPPCCVILWQPVARNDSCDLGPICVLL